MGRELCGLGAGGCWAVSVVYLVCKLVSLLFLGFGLLFWVYLVMVALTFIDFGLCRLVLFL